MATLKKFLAKNGLDNNAQTITNVATPVNTTDAVTKAYADLKPNLSSTTPAALGVATVGTGTTAARSDHVHAMGNLTGDVTSVGLATTLTNAPVIAKVLTGYVSGAGTVAATDSIRGAIQKLNGNTPIASSTTPAALGTAAIGTGTTFARADHVHQSPTTVSGNAGTATSIAGGVANNVPYQTAAGTTAFVPVSTVAGQVLTTAAAGGAPTWVTPTAITLSSAITGYVAGANTALAATDTILAAFGKLQGQVTARGVGTVTGVTATAPVVSSGGTAPVISMAAATTSVPGYLTAADWNTFNGKYSTGGALGTPSSGTLTNCTFPTLNQNTTGTATNASYLNGTSQTSLLVGKVSNTVDINGANDAGSMSVRGDATYPACMSFHRSGVYAINMGLSNANNFVIGGWSASSNAFSMTGGGALTMLNSITSYSDERLKKNWRKLPIDFVERLASVKHGIYDRTDQECTQVGVSAQSLQPLLPDAIMTQVDGMLSVSYGNAALVSAVQLAKEVVLLKEQSSMQSNTIELLIEAIKQQQVQIDELKELINKGK